MKTLRIGCVFAGFLSLPIWLSAQTFTTLYAFSGWDGWSPVRATGTGHQWRLLRDDLRRRLFPSGCAARGDGLRDHPKRHADDGLRLLLPRLLH